MHDTGPNRPVTKSARRAVQNGDDAGARKRTEHAEEQDRTRGVRELFPGQRSELEAEKPPGPGTDRHGERASYRAEVYAASGDVDKDGEIVDRLREAMGDEAAHMHLASVLRLIAAGRALEAAALAETEGWTL